MRETERQRSFQKRFIILCMVWVLLWSTLPLMASGVGAGDIEENMPTVPPEKVQLICPYSVMTANSLQFNNYSGELYSLFDWFTAPFLGTTNFTGMNFTSPYPISPGITVLEDKLWINELVPIDMADVNVFLGTTYPELEVSPIVVMDTDLMTWNDSEMYDQLTYGLGEFDTNLTIIDRSWFAPYVLDFRIYDSAFIDLEILGSPRNITVMGLWVTNCSRETYWQETEQFFYSYYTTQKKYETTLQVENTISASHYYDVRWYVGFPANRTVDPSTLRVYDLDNGLYLTLGQHYDASNAGVWMSFTRLNMSVARSFTFDIWGWNATIGIGTAIAFSDEYVQSAIGSTSYFKSTPTWTNNYGRVYQGAVFIQLSLTDGVQRHIDPSSVKIYDKVAGAYLQPWQYAVNGGLIVLDYAIVPVGSVQNYDVYFHLDMSGSGFNILDTAFMVGGLAVTWLALMFIASGIMAIIYWGTKLKIVGYGAAMVFAFALIFYYFGQMGGI